MHSGVSNSSTGYVRLNRFSGVCNVLQFLNTLCSDVCVYILMFLFRIVMNLFSRRYIENVTYGKVESLMLTLLVSDTMQLHLLV